MRGENKRQRKFVSTGDQTQNHQVMSPTHHWATWGGPSPGQTQVIYKYASDRREMTEIELEAVLKIIHFFTKLFTIPFRLLKTLKRKALENTVEKGENAGDSVFYFS